MANEAFTLEDQLAANCVLVIATQPVIEKKRMQMWLDILAEILPAVNRNHFMMHKLAKAADDLLGTAGLGLSHATFSLARWRASGAAADFAEWRAGEVQAAIQAKKA
jgi:hypothetical protein